MEFRVLGPLEIELNGDRLRVANSREQRILAALLLDVDRVVPMARLVDAVWDDRPPHSAAKAVRNCVSTLRHRLEAPGTSGGLITTEPAGYALRVQDDQVDLKSFALWVSQGRQLASTGRLEPAIKRLRAALALWRGDALAGVSGRTVEAAAARLDEQRLAAQEECLSYELALGHDHQLLDELFVLVAAQPLRERPRGQLMLALYRSGRRGEALETYRCTRRILVEEIGVEPGRELTELHRAILAGDPLLNAPTAPPSLPTANFTEASPAVAVAREVEMCPAPTEAAEACRAPVRVISAQVRGSSQVVGRDKELTALRKGLIDVDRPGRPTLRVLTGLGGVGKTTLARAYADRYQQDYELVWWVRAEDLDVVAGEFRALLEILVPHDVDRIRDPIQAAHTVLANRAGPWLLILDNVASATTLNGLMPAAGDGHVIVTSRSGNWFDGQVVLAVKPLSQGDAVRLVTSLSGDPDQAAAAVLARELGGLPLALAQAGSYVAHNAMGLDVYLALYRQRRADMHGEGHVPDYSETVSTTWRLTSDLLPRSSRALLNLICWYASDAIPLDRLFTADAARLHLPPEIDRHLRPLLRDELQLHRATTDLVSYGLLTLTEPQGSVSVHRLVQAVTADHLAARNESGMWIKAAAVLLEAACPEPPVSLATITVWRSLQRHVTTLIQHLHPDDHVALSLRHTLAEWTGETGNSARAHELYVALVEDDERLLGPDHRDTLVGRSRLAYWTGETGDSARAHKLYTALVEDDERLLGPDHRDTLIARNYLADWTGEAGDVARARELCAAVVADMVRLLGPDDPETLLARAYLAYWTGEAGQPVAARKMCAVLVEDRKRVFGPDHPTVLMALANLARWTARAGAIASAREMCAGLVSELVSLFGLDDRDMRIAEAFFAYWTEETVDSALGRDLYAMLVDNTHPMSDPHQRNILIRRAVLDTWATKMLRQEAVS